LFAVLAVGIGTAYAGVLPLITLAGDVLITGDTELEGKLLDTNDDAGTSGQVLSSTETGMDWIDNTGSDTLAGLGCTTDQIVKFDGNNWVCSDGITLDSLECTPGQILRYFGVPKMFVVGVVGQDINEYTLTTPFDVSTADFVDSFSVVGQETEPRGLAFSSDGTKMFVLGNDGNDVNEYMLTTPFDVSTGIFVDSFSVAAQETVPTDLAFSSDGDKMFVVGNVGDAVYEYTLTTPFDVSTASFVDSFSVAAQDTFPTGIAFSSDGTKMFVLGTIGDAVYEYTLSIAFDVSTASFVDAFSVAAQDITPTGVAFSSDGAKMFVVGIAGDDVNEYTLGTPFDVSTATFVVSFSVAAQETFPTGVAFSSGGWICSTENNSCPNNTSQVGTWCIDNISRTLDTYVDAVIDCADEGMQISSVESLIVCDLTNLSSSECGALTDDGSTRLWTSDVSHETTTSVDLFDRVNTYKGDNDLIEVDITGNEAFEYFCIKTLS